MNQPPPVPSAHQPTGGADPAASYYRPPVWQEQPRPVLTLGAFAALCAGVLTLVVVGLALATPAALDDGAGVFGDPNAALPRSVALYALGSLLYVVGLLACYVVTCLWLYRARRNAELLSPTWSHRRARGWVWGGWLVPIVQLWFPYQVVRDVARTTNPTGATPAILPWWWTTWIAAIVCGQIKDSLVDSVLSQGGSAGGAEFFTFAWAAMMLVAFVCWVVVIRSVVTTQESAIRDQAWRPG